MKSAAPRESWRDNVLIPFISVETIRCGLSFTGAGFQTSDSIRNDGDGEKVIGGNPSCGPRSLLLHSNARLGAGGASSP
jgi:hypothetical protein